MNREQVDWVTETVELFKAALVSFTEEFERCVTALERIQQEAREELERKCRYCGKPLMQRDGETDTNFKRRLTCDRTCGALQRWRGTTEALPQRRCKKCDKPLERKQYPSGSWETASAFKRRLYCDNTCRIGAMRSEAPAAAAPQAPPAPAKPPTPPPPPPPKRVPQPPIKAPNYDPKSIPTPPRREPVIEAYEAAPMRPDGPVERCPEHGDVIGVYGCPGCNAGRKWRETQGTRYITPTTNPTRSSS